MGNPLEHRCICCWRKESVHKWGDGIPHVCPDCLKLLGPGDKAAIITAMRHTELLSEIRGHLSILAENNENDENQLGSIAKAFENFGRMLKLPAGKAVELSNQVQAFIRLLHEQAEKAARDGGDDDHEPWRESLRD